MERAISRSWRAIEFTLGGMGFYITLKVPKRLQHRWWIVGPAAAVLVVLGLAAGFIAWKAEYASANRRVEELHEEVAKASEQLNEIRMAQARIEESLHAMQSSAAESDKTESMSIRALEKIFRQTPPAEMSRARLYRRVMALVRKVREMNARQRLEDSQYWSAFADATRQAGTAAQLQQISARNMAAGQRLHAAHQYEYQMRLVGEAQYVAGELQHRVPDLPAPEAEARLALTGVLLGADPLLELANYLELAAKKLRG